MKKSWPPAEELVQLLPLSLLVCSESQKILSVNNECSSIFGLSGEQIIGRKLKALSEAFDSEAFLEFQKNPDEAYFVCEIRTFDGEPLPVRITRSSCLPEEGQDSISLYCIESQARDGNSPEEPQCDKPAALELKKTRLMLEGERRERRKLSRLLRDSDYRDPLTGLPNRSMFTEYLQHAFNKYKHRGGYTFAVLYLDLDHFRSINDLYGHSVGDCLLQETAERLKKCLRDVDTVARLGGDEFIVLMDQIGDPSQTIKVANRIVEAMKEPIACGETSLKVGMNIGIALAENRHESPREIIRDADIALSHVKQEGNRKYSLFQGELQKKAIKKMKIENALRQAASESEFHLHYQPIVELEKGHLKGFEALLRWDSPEFGPVSPEVFIPIAEESEIIFDIGRWVLLKACTDMSTWLPHLKDRSSRLTISVNISPRQLQSAEILQDIKHALEKSGLEPEHLVIEVTENAVFTDMDKALTALNAIKDMGVKLHLDDFGEGYSSLNLLYRFPFDTMKIDRSYINGLQHDNESSEVVRTIIRLGHSMKKQVIAEGIETLSEASALKDFNCELGQGFYFSRPLDEKKARSFALGV